MRVQGASVAGRTSSGNTTAEADPGEKPAILLVVEDRRLCDSLAALLRVVDYDVFNVYSGAEALVAASRMRFDAAVIDTELRDMDAVEVLMALREADPDLGALMVSCADTLQYAIESLKRGADAFVMKPSDPEDLLLKLGKVARLKRLQRDLRESEARYRGLFESIGDGAFQSDLEGNFTAINCAGAEILGFEGPEGVLCGGVKEWETYVSREEHEVMKMKVLRQGEVRSVFRRFRRRDGALGWLETTVRVRRDTGGAVAGFEGVFRNVTDRFRYQVMLEALHGLFADFVEADSVEEVGELTLEFLRGALDIDAGSFATVDDGVIRHIVGNTVDLDPFEAYLNGWSISLRAVSTGEPQVATDALMDLDRISDSIDRDSEICSLLVVPVKLGCEVIALIEAGSARPDAFTDEDIKLVEIVGEQVSSTLYRLVRSKLDVGPDVKLKDYM